MTKITENSILKRMNEAKTIIHPFAPFYRSDSAILILGSIPSVASRENGFYYGHPRNRFWKMLAVIFGEDTPHATEEKMLMLLKHKIALYDAIKQCTIEGSADNSIRNVVPANIEIILQNSSIIKIIANGQAAAKYFTIFQKPYRTLLCTMPSTSPANAAFSLESLVKLWRPALMHQ